MKIAALAFLVCLSVAGSNSVISGQGKVSRLETSHAAESTSREQDGLIGPVRRVRVETAKLTVKEGKPIEGPRSLREVTIYDSKGRKVDSVAYPIGGSSLIGKEQYKYDDKGNISEMVLRAEDGTILSNEKYDYEFDEFGNWKKMRSSVAVYENGAVSYEPLEVTYRTISYFYSEAVDKLAQPSPKIEVGSAKSISGALQSNTSTSLRSAEDLPMPGMGEKQASGEKVSSAASNSESKDDGSNNLSSLATVPDKHAISEKTVETTAPADPTKPTNDSPAAPLPVKRVSEEQLRSAAIELPQPDYPQEAMIAGADGKVEVQILVDEKGNVLNARATSGHPLLAETAEASARKSRFMPSKASSDPSRLYGVITYTFTLPPAVNLTVASSVSRPVIAENIKPVPSSPSPASINEAASSESTESLYKKGVAYLSEGRHSEAVEPLKRAVQRNPNDAVAYVKLGLAYYGSHQYQETITVLKMAVRISPEAVDAEAYYRLGQAYAALGRHADSLKSFTHALYSKRAQAIEAEGAKAGGFPSLEEIHYSLGLSSHHLGRSNDAIKELKQVIKLNPNIPEAYYALAIDYIAIGDLMSAEKQQKILSSLNPTLARKLADEISMSRTPDCSGLFCR